MLVTGAQVGLVLGSTERREVGAHCDCMHVGELESMRPMLPRLLALPRLLTLPKLLAVVSCSMHDMVLSLGFYVGGRVFGVVGVLSSERRDLLLID
jgi:hypothetical protein